MTTSETASQVRMESLPVFGQVKHGHRKMSLDAVLLAITAKVILSS